MTTPLKIYHDKIKSGALKSDPAQERAMESLERLFEDVALVEEELSKNWFQKLGRRKDARNDLMGVYLYGGVGRGKSMLMDMFFGCLYGALKRRRVHFHDFMIEVHNYLHERRMADDFGDGVDSALPALACRIAEKMDVLCFDEFHVTDVADAMILGRLFTTLFDRGVVVVATSNWPPDRLYEGGLQRDRFIPFINLLKDKMEVIHLDSPTDYRKEFIAEEGTYFWPMGEKAEEKADGLFRSLTENAEPEPHDMQVKGRTIRALYTAKGVARFSFAQLCEQPHGAEDYLAIAREFHTVFLEGIPKLGYDRRNEAKRLMTFIDALYEQKTRLIVTADAPPDKLYTGHDHAFEFERTISRLIEMQSEGYLQKAA